MCKNKIFILYLSLHILIYYLETVAHVYLWHNRVTQICVVGGLNHISHHCREHPVVRDIPIVTNTQINGHRPTIYLVYAHADNRVEPHIASRFAQTNRVVEICRDIDRATIATYDRYRWLDTQPVDKVVARKDTDTVLCPVARMGVERITKTESPIALLLCDHLVGGRTEEHDCKRNYRH